jgi:hypothetical protein
MPGLAGQHPPSIPLKRGEHTFRMLEQTLGWTTPMLRDPNTADTWTWVVLAAHTQLRLARPLAADHHLPWQRPARPGCLTPARVRRDFRNIHQTMTSPTQAPNPSGPCHPLGTKNCTGAPRPAVGKKHPKQSSEIKRQANFVR